MGRGLVRRGDVGWRRGEPPRSQDGARSRPGDGLPQGRRGRRRARAWAATPARGLRVYASDQAHFSIARALDILGIGSDALVSLPTERDRRLDPQRLDAALRHDRHRGFQPMAIRGDRGDDQHRTLEKSAAGHRACARRHGTFPARGCGLRGRSALLAEGPPAGSKASTGPTRSPSTRTSGCSSPSALAVLLVRDRERLRASCAIEPDYLRKDLEHEPDPSRSVPAFPRRLAPVPHPEARPDAAVDRDRGARGPRGTHPGRRPPPGAAGPLRPALRNLRRPVDLSTVVLRYLTGVGPRRCACFAASGARAAAV
jgi:hypothetical protein